MNLAVSTQFAMMHKPHSFSPIKQRNREAGRTRILPLCVCLQFYGSSRKLSSFLQYIMRAQL